MLSRSPQRFCNSPYSAPTSGSEKLQNSIQCNLVQVAPFWSRQPWFPVLLRLLADQPRSLPPSPDLLYHHLARTFHPRPENFRLHDWLLSSDPSKRGFSEESARLIAKPRRSSSQIYDSKWARFSRWCDGKSLDLLIPSLQLIADILVDLFSIEINSSFQRLKETNLPYGRPSPRWAVGTLRGTLSSQTC